MKVYVGDIHYDNKRGLLAEKDWSSMWDRVSQFGKAAGESFYNWKTWRYEPDNDNVFSSRRVRR